MQAGRSRAPGAGRGAHRSGPGGDPQEAPAGRVDEQPHPEAARLEAEITAIDQAKAETLADANLPVKGLAFTENSVTFDGLPLEQASQAQQLRISVAIASALNPKLRAMLVRDGSLLDAESLALLKAEATTADLQLWLEQVGKDGEGIVIEDGMVEGAEAEVARG